MKKMMDGNTAAAHSAYAASEVAAIYPITPSSLMAELTDEWSNAGRKNILNQPASVVEMQSEAGAAGAVHGSLAGGALTTTFTASQGLLLMIPNMYKIAGEQLPAVFHVSARTVATHALSIFGDHSDVMAVRQTGFNMLASNNPQEAMDMATIAHMSAIESSLPFLHFFDGFRTSHQISNVDVIDYDTIEKLINNQKIEEFKLRSLNPNSPHQQGTAQNPDIFFQNREASNTAYSKVVKIVEDSFTKLEKETGRSYGLFDYVGAKDAEKVIVIMGSGSDTVEETVKHLNNNGQKLGVVKVRLFRPFSVSHFLNALPETVKKVAVLDRTKENNSLGEPLYQDVVSVLANKGLTVVGGRYGLGGKDFTPNQAKAVFDNLSLTEPKNSFTVGINDDITNTSLALENFVIENENQINCKFFGLGGDGTVSANKSAIKIIGESTDFNAQGFFEYDSKKSGSTTISHLRFGRDTIKSNYKVLNANYIACHKDVFVNKYNMISDLKQNGTFVINTDWSEEELFNNLPNSYKIMLAKKNAKLYAIDAVKLASEIGLDGKINTVMESVFFYLANIIEFKDAKNKLKELSKKAYSKKGEQVVEMNNLAIEKAVANLKQINYPATWDNLELEKETLKETDPYYKNVIKPILDLKGDELPVSSFSADGYVPTDTIKYEKRDIAEENPIWLSEKCIQCNQCAFVCPHAAIRPVLITDEEAKGLPEEFVLVDAKGETNLKYRMQINPQDCTGCSNCVNVCPTAALIMQDNEIVKDKELNNYNLSLKLKPATSKFDKTTVKGSQYQKPYFEFSGACAGCGETPYIKLLTQLFGDRMVIANATGCSSIYGGSAPTCPYATDENGCGPAWANSLFEDNAEFGLGIHLANKVTTGKLLTASNNLINSKLNNDNLKAYLKMYVNNYNDEVTTKNLVEKLNHELMGSLKQETDKEVLNDLTFINSNLNHIIPKSTWIIGGDGWAYDIGFSGLDHVLASGENVNMLVLDTEVYSNTGGQSSKASPAGSVAKFTAGGKKTRKKDLGQMAMTYGDVYVASVALGANPNQLVKALKEAESFDGPSLIIAYSTCINHGIDMSNFPKIMKAAVNSGYWNLYRYNPTLIAEGKNPFIYDSKRADTSTYKEYLKTQNRYNTLERENPKEANRLFEEAKTHADERHSKFKKMAGIE